MKQIFKFFLLITATAALYGCAHPINMSPDLAKVKGTGAPLIDKQVGYHIPDSARALELTTPGGGGDKVRYFPYRDIESGFYKALSEVFKGVTKVANPKDFAAISSSGISLLILPEITTTSFSESILTWPPTLFTVTLDCKVLDAKGQELKNVRVQGEGRASFDEFKSNFSLAAVRASDDALAKLMQEFSDNSDFRR